MDIIKMQNGLSWKQLEDRFKATFGDLLHGWENSSYGNDELPSFSNYDLDLQIHIGFNNYYVNRNGNHYGNTRENLLGGIAMRTFEHETLKEFLALCQSIQCVEHERNMMSKIKKLNSLRKEILKHAQEYEAFGGNLDRHHQFLKNYPFKNSLDEVEDWADFS